MIDTERSGQRAPLLVGRRGDRNPCAIAGASIDPVRCVSAISIALGARLLAAELIFNYRPGHQFDRALDLRKLDPLPLSGPFSLMQGGQDTEGSRQTAHGIAKR